MEKAEVAVVGGGVVGLSVARAVASAGRSVVLLERHDRLGTEQSTHNSQVIHSGLFARPGTLRARLNVEGARLLYEYARASSVPVDRSGTLVVAGGPGEVDRLDRYERWGRENGLTDLVRLAPREAREVEPRLGRCHEALLSPSGGRIDAARLVERLEQDCGRLGVAIVRGFDLGEARFDRPRWELRSRDGAAVDAGWVVNSAGVESGRVAERLGAAGHRIFPCLGEYARIRGDRRFWVRSMIYGFPPPGYPGIGVHLTRSLDGDLWLGPTATYLDRPEPPVAPITSLETFLAEAEPYLPGLRLEDLEPAPSGIRAKVVPPGSSEAFDDYVVERAPAGRPAVQLIGIESPGLTACLALGAWVERTISSA